VSHAPLRSMPRLVAALAIATAVFAAAAARHGRSHVVEAPVAVAPVHAGVVAAHVPAAGLLTATLYDLAGTRVRVLTAGEPHAQGDVRLAWDGLDESGRPAPAGAYALKLEVQGHNVRAERVTHLRWPAIPPGA
jgi:hypothetical protein